MQTDSAVSSKPQRKLRIGAHQSFVLARGLLASGQQRFAVEAAVHLDVKHLRYGLTHHYFRTITGVRIQSMPRGMRLRHSVL